MTIRRRDFISLGAATLATGMLADLASCKTGPQKEDAGSTGTLKPMTGDVVPISKSEREARIAKAQRLLAENKMDALVLESGTALRYFTGISWWPSERTMAAIIPAKGEVKYVCPAFEEARFREQITIGSKVYTWQEDESPYQLIANAIKDSGIVSGTVGIEENVRFFKADGIRKAAPN